ncbi:MAG: hypothetical protein AAFU53_06700 [Cyanobacteria bacterium J06632_3]
MRRNRSALKIFLGVCLLFLAHIVVIMGLVALISVLPRNGLNNTLQTITFFAVFAIGIFQIVYALPMMLYLQRRRQDNLLKGVSIGVVITVLLNGGCFLLIR